ncbi:MAG: ribonuclease H family protein [Tissierellaceae bacterium]
MAKFYYGVKCGKNPGVYESWAECEAEVKGYRGAKYKKFKTYEEALNFVRDEEQPIYKETEEKDVDNLKDGEMIAYVDGSFSANTNTYSYGVVIITREGIEKFSGRDDDRALAEMRNVSGELKGAMVAMELALDRGITRLYLHYDYMGIEEWAKGNWKRNKEGTKAYKSYYDSISHKLEVVFVKVLAHSGVKYNEEADRLAKEAILCVDEE